MNITGIELVDDLIYKHLHRSYMNDVNACLKRGIFEFDCKNILNDFITGITSLNMVMVCDYSENLKTLIGALTLKLCKLEVCTERMRLNVIANLPYKTKFVFRKVENSLGEIEYVKDENVDKIYGTPARLYLMVCGNRLSFSGMSHIYD